MSTPRLQRSHRPDHVIDLTDGHTRRAATRVIDRAITHRPEGPATGAPGTIDAHALVDESLPHPRRQVRAYLMGLPSLMVGSDVVALAVAYAIVRPPLPAALLFAGLWLAGRVFTRAYRPRITVSILDDVPRWLGVALAAMGTTAAVQEGANLGGQDGRVLLGYAGVALIVALLLSVLVQAGTRRTRRHRGAADRTIIVGTGSVGRLLGRALVDNPQLGLLPVGYVAERHGPSPLPFSQQWPELAAPVLADRVDHLGRTIDQYRATTVILAFAEMPDTGAVDTIITAHQRGSTVLVVPHVLDLHADGPDVDRVCGVPLVRLRPDPTLRASWWVKRGFDVTVGVLSLLLLSPLLAAVAVLTLLDSGRPILFWQQRIGLDGRPFRLCKFRSMRTVPVTESQTTWSIADDPRVTRLGKFLRTSSLDEVPQLWNIVRGDMSLVGPRPERPTFVAQFSDEHERYWARHRVPVGLTGLAQVNGLRGDTSISDRARYDNYYIANWSLWLDLKIALLTAREVLRGSGG